MTLDLRQSMRNGGGPACLRLRVPLSDAERTAIGARVFVDDALAADLAAWIGRHYRDRLAPEDLADPALLDESRAALDDLTRMLRLPSVYPFQLGHLGRLRARVLGARKRDRHAAVLLPLVLDLRDHDRSDLARIRDVRAAACLQVDARPAPAAPARPRGGATASVRTRSSRAGNASSSIHSQTSMTGLDQRVDLAVISLLGCACRHVEVETGAIATDRAAGHGKRKHRRKQVTGGVHAHVRVAAVPVRGQLTSPARGAAPRETWTISPRLALQRVDHGSDGAVARARAFRCRRAARRHADRRSCSRGRCPRIGGDDARLAIALVGKSRNSQAVIGGAGAWTTPLVKRRAASTVTPDERSLGLRDCR